MELEEILASIDPTGEWSTDGYGIDSNLVHCVMIEQDCPRCPECGEPNPLMAYGII